MSNVIKTLNFIDKIFINTNQYMHLALHLSDSSKTGMMIDKIHKLMIGSHSRVDGDNVVRVDTEPLTVKIPDNFKTLHESIEFMKDKHLPNINNRLVCVGANKNTIVINAHHMFSDGGFLKNLFETLRDDKNADAPQKIETTLDVFGKDIEEAKSFPIDISVNPALTRLFTKDHQLTGYNANGRTSIASGDVSSFKCFDMKAGKPRMFTDALYASTIFTVSAYTNNFSSQGVGTVLDMRRYLNVPKNTFELGDLYSSLSITGHANIDTKVIDLMKQTRASFESQIKNRVHFGFLKKMLNPVMPENPIPGGLVSISNVGVFKLGGSIDDVALDVSFDTRNKFESYFLTQYSVVDKKKNRSVLLGKYPLSYMSEREADLLTQSILFCLKNIDMNATCGEALEKTKDFQNKFIKEEYPKYIKN